MPKIEINVINVAFTIKMCILTILAILAFLFNFDFFRELTASHSKVQNKIQNKSEKFRQFLIFHVKVYKMKAKLVAYGIKSKKLKQRLFELDPEVPEFVFGRSRDATCMILDVAVSRKHAIFKFSEEWNVTDNQVYFEYFIPKTD